MSRPCNSVGPEWQAFFASLRDEGDDVLFQARGPSWKPSDWLEGKVLAPAAFTEEQALEAARDTLAARTLIRNYRTRGHLIAKLDPLELSTRKEHPELRPRTYGFTKADYDRPIYLGGALGLEFGTLRQVLDILKRVYGQHIGTEYMHISDPEQRQWMQDRLEGPDDIRFTPQGKKAILKKLIEAEIFERFLDVKYTGTKRFGLDGGEVGGAGARAGHQARRAARPEGDRHRHAASGAAQRARQCDGEALPRDLQRVQGRLGHPRRGRGLGRREISSRRLVGPRLRRQSRTSVAHRQPVASRDRRSGGARQGRAKQDQLHDRERREVLPLLLHGDAAFAGQGVVAECFGLSGLRGHRTGGSLHFIVNNQIGFTTAPRFARSSPYPSDVAKMIDAPIFHVNGDDPEAVVYVAKIAMEFRQRFGKPVVIDMFCYRRHGHNEADERPSLSP